MIELYHKIHRQFQNERELVSVHFSKYFDNAKVLAQSGSEFIEAIKNEALEDRRDLEEHYYRQIESQLIHRIQEIKHYSDVNVLDSRRMVSVSADCITSVHIMVREAIHLNVYFRSSDFDNALPVDLEFLSSLPSLFINHLIYFAHHNTYKEVNEEVINILNHKPVKLNLMFGSLHRTN